MVTLINTRKPTNDDLLAALMRLDCWALPEHVRGELPFYQRVALGLQPVRNRLLTMYRNGLIVRRLLNGRKYVYRAPAHVPGTTVPTQSRLAVLSNLCGKLIPGRWNQLTGGFSAILHDEIMSSKDPLEQRELLLSVDCITYPLTLEERKAVIRATSVKPRGLR